MPGLDNRLIWFKENIIPLNEATINILAPTSQFGVNVFEGVRCYWNDRHKQLYAFELDEHIRRLLNSVKLLRLDIKYDFQFLKKSFIDVIRANNYKEDIAVRQTIFLDGFGSWSSFGPTEMFIAPIPKGRQFGDREGIHCCVSSWERINDNSIPLRGKIGANYVNSRMAQIEAMTNGYDSAILLNNNGKISEGPGSCIFIVRNEELITPPVTASILESITRNVIMHIAREELKLSVKERDIDRNELYISDEVFLCGTAVEITPVLSIDKIYINDGKRGEKTKQLTNFYFDIVRGNIEKYLNRLTPIY
jgi:branched-chain amino acid aminotransferase